MQRKSDYLERENVLIVYRGAKYLTMYEPTAIAKSSLAGQMAICLKNGLNIFLSASAVEMIDLTPVIEQVTDDRKPYVMTTIRALVSRRNNLDIPIGNLINEIDYYMEIEKAAHDYGESEEEVEDE